MTAQLTRLTTPPVGLQQTQISYIDLYLDEISRSYNEIIIFCYKTIGHETQIHPVTNQQYFDVPYYIRLWYEAMYDKKSKKAWWL